MDLTGVIFGAIAAAWLLYIVPGVLSRRDQRAEEAEPGRPFTSKLRQVHRGAPEDEPVNEDLDVSTPLIRRARMRRLRRLAQQSAQRRRRLLLMLVATTVTLAITSAIGQTYWWAAGLALAALVVFVPLSRARAVREGEAMRAIADRIRYGEDEPTVVIDLFAEQPQERSVELSAPIEFSGSLWDPVPVTAPTYVQKPLSPRTVRTIDLSAPEAAARVVPPTADRPADAPAPAAHVAEVVELPRAVGE